jgi:hypothetical protein
MCGRRLLNFQPSESRCRRGSSREAIRTIISVLCPLPWGGPTIVFFSELVAFWSVPNASESPGSLVLARASGSLTRRLRRLGGSLRLGGLGGPRATLPGVTLGLPECPAAAARDRRGPMPVREHAREALAASIKGPGGPGPRRRLARARPCQRRAGPGRTSATVDPPARCQRPCRAVHVTTRRAGQARAVPGLPAAGTANSGDSR